MRSGRLPPALRAGLAIVGALGLAALSAPLLAPYDPAEQLDSVAGKERPPGTVLQAVHLADETWLLAERARRTASGLAIEYRGRSETLPAERVLNLTADGVADRRVFLLGSDRFGRDLLSRILYGARVSLAVGLLAVALAATLGVAVGSAAAVGGPLLDMVLMRGVDALLAFPTLFLLVAAAALFQPSDALIVLLLGGTGWMGISRLTRAEVRSLARREFVLAARAMGQRPLAILRRHLLPNALTPVLVQATLLVGNVILAESGLSFLGLGIQPPAPSWGNMIAEGRLTLTTAWWVAVFPGACLSLTVVAFNLLGDGLRDALDPRTRRQVVAE